MVNRETKPKNWPSSLPYLKVPRYSKNLTPEQLQLVRQQPRAGTVHVIPANEPRGPTSVAKITPIVNPSHPANGQAGLLAARDLKPGQLIVQYIGELHSSCSAEDVAEHSQSDYDLWIDRDAGVAVDASRAGCEARFVNDFRGVADRPNAEFREVWDAARKERGIAVFVLPERKGTKARSGPQTKSGIKKGSEILVSYGKGFWGGRNGGQTDAGDCNEQQTSS
ncbi:SET domain-containing protein [Zalerion maritima]|uniref:SET domain-containing protein n=1 Tax=Zalerion maritima TaxID=339359 RepID=A0AAD5RND3_9PEZI|nr:SET domain-containing protein [Zalerion maritima]